MLRINTVTIIGANGAMGSSVAGIFASFGKATVFMVSRDIKKSEDAIEKAIGSVKAESIRERLIAKSYEELETCIKQSDWIFESVTENFEIKAKINEIIASSIRTGTIVSSGTSGLSITDLSERFNERDRKLFFGTHFFNPPYSLPLCELVESNYSDLKKLYEIKEYLEVSLKRKVIIVKDKPGFLANRIGFQFLNEVALMAEEYSSKGGIDYMDAIFGGFSGHEMKPLTTIDFVGLDVHKAIVDNLYYKTNDFAKSSFVLPKFVAELINCGKLGRKTSMGLYFLEKYEDGTSQKMVYDIETRYYRKSLKYSFSFAEGMVKSIRDGEYYSAIEIMRNDQTIEGKICQYLLYKYVIYSIKIGSEVTETIHNSDIAMSYGYNWIPPLAILNLVKVENFIEDLNHNPYRNRINLSDSEIRSLISSTVASKIDYRRYLKAKI